MFQLQCCVFWENKSRTVTVEGLLPADFQKYINNICLNDLDITGKSETFVHYTYEISNNRLITDLQGVGYQLCDPEIATQTIVEEKSDKSKMLVEDLF